MSSISILKLTSEKDANVGVAGGRGRGVDEASWPRAGGVPMQHLITVRCDALTIPCGDAFAVAVFISDLADNEAFAPDTDQSAVRFLDEAAFERASWAGAPEGAPEHFVGVERRSFNADEVANFEEFDEDERAPVDELDEEQQMMALASYFETLNDLAPLGLSCEYVSWLQAPECPADQRVLFWLEEKSALNTNFGTGCFYISGNGEVGAAWFQC